MRKAFQPFVKFVIYFPLSGGPVFLHLLKDVFKLLFVFFFGQSISFQANRKNADKKQKNGPMMANTEITVGKLEINPTISFLFFSFVYLRL